MALALWTIGNRILAGMGTNAVRRFTWGADGRWTVTDRAGRTHAVTLHPSSLRLGAWLFLVWREAGGRRFRALIEVRGTGQTAFRTLKGRLNC